MAQTKEENAMRLGLLARSRWTIAVLIVAGGLAVASPASAQYLGGSVPNAGSVDNAPSAAGGSSAVSGQGDVLSAAAFGFQPVDSDGLAFTGADVMGLAFFAVLLVVVGAGFVTASRRRGPDRG
jgi:hypothetical protein